MSIHELCPALKAGGLAFQGYLAKFIQGSMLQSHKEAMEDLLFYDILKVSPDLDLQCSYRLSKFEICYLTYAKWPTSYVFVNIESMFEGEMNSLLQSIVITV